MEDRVRRSSNSQSHEAMRANLAERARLMARGGFITAQTAAERSGKGLATIYRWIRMRMLEAKTTGAKGMHRRQWVSEESFTKLMASDGSQALAAKPKRAR